MSPVSRVDVAVPFAVDGRGRTAQRGYDDHVRDLVELLLFTSPGERVMRPDFGCGLADLVFEPNSPELAATVQLSIQASLQRWLGDVLEVGSVEVAADDGRLRVSVVYTVRATGTTRDDVFVGSVKS
jgi:phage baseplate assembly protein W